MPDQKTQNSTNGGGWPTSAKITSIALGMVATAAVAVAITSGGNSETGPMNADGPAERAVGASAEKIDTGGPSSEPTEDSASGASEFGETIDLQGSGTTVSVTPEELLPGLEPAPFQGVGKNKELIAVLLSLRNTGTKQYSGFPSNDIVMIDSESGQWEAGVSDASGCRPTFYDVRILPGSERRGCVTFAVPKGTKASEIQMSLNSGTSSSAGVWAVP